MASLFVYMNGYEVGEYIQRRSGAQEFIYGDAWLANRSAIPLSLSLPLTDRVHKGNAVYNYFDNLLPDSLDIRSRIQSRFGAAANKPFELLSEIGRDCVGAIKLLPERTEVDVKSITGTRLSKKDIALELRNYRTLPLGMSKEHDFRISIAGAQEKTAFLKHKGKWLRPSGITPTTHIFKLPIGKIEHAGIDLSDSVENEWLCLEILKAFGLPVISASIETFEDIRVLVVERFDRELAADGTWIIRHPVEDMCQAHGIAPALKYENEGGPGISSIMETLKASMHAETDRKQFMKTVFLFWMLGAIDGHAKNFSIFLKPGGRFQLTPVYDVISAYPLVAKRQLEYQNLKMAMSLKGRNRHYVWSEIMPRHWYAESGNVNFPDTEMEAIIEQSLDTLEGVLSSVQSRLPPGFPDEIATPVFDNIRKVANKF
jgi:serine/threonine-protein kinase HipA